MADIYTQPPMEQRLAEARSMFGDNPSAVQAGIATNMTNSATYQDPLKSQQNAMTAIQQVANYDKELAGKYQTGAQQTTAQIGANNALLTNFASAGATPAETIAKGQQAIPTTQEMPVSGFLSPFVASGLATGQSNASKGVYDIATQTKSALDKIIGTEAQAYADALRYQIQQEQLKAEQERLIEEAKNQKIQNDFNAQIELLKLTGGSIVNPFDGKTYIIPKPKEDKTGTFDLASALEAIRSGGQTINQANSRPPISQFDIPDESSSAKLIAPFAGGGGGMAGSGGGAG
jgi:hypothetical protein